MLSWIIVNTKQKLFRNLESPDSIFIAEAKRNGPLTELKS